MTNTCEMLNSKYYQKPRCPKIIAVDWADCYLECVKEKCEYWNKRKNECGVEIKYEQCEGHLEYQDFGYWICNSCGSMLDERICSIFPEDMM